MSIWIPNPKLEDNMVLFKYPDPRSGKQGMWLIYKFSKRRLDLRSICFKEIAPYFHKFGLETTPHWSSPQEVLGYLGVYGVKIVETYQPERFEVHPVVSSILSSQGIITNKQAAAYLLKEG